MKTVILIKSLILFVSLLAFNSNLLRAQVRLKYVSDSIVVGNAERELKFFSEYKMYGEYLNEAPIAIIDSNKEFLYLYNPRLSLHKVSLKNLKEIERIVFSDMGRESEVELSTNNCFILLKSSERIELFDIHLNSLVDFKDSLGIETECMSEFYLSNYQCDLYENKLVINLEMIKSPRSDYFYRKVYCFNLNDFKKE